MKWLFRIIMMLALMVFFNPQKSTALNEGINLQKSIVIAVPEETVLGIATLESIEKLSYIIINTDLIAIQEKLVAQESAKIIQPRYRESGELKAVIQTNFYRMRVDYGSINRFVLITNTQINSSKANDINLVGSMNKLLINQESSKQEVKCIKYSLT